MEDNSLRQGMFSFRRRPLPDLSIPNRDLGGNFPEWGTGKPADLNSECPTPSRGSKTPSKELKTRITVPFPPQQARNMPCDYGNFCGVRAGGAGAAIVIRPRPPVRAHPLLAPRRAPDPPAAARPARSSRSGAKRRCRGRCRRENIRRTARDRETRDRLRCRSESPNTARLPVSSFRNRSRQPARQFARHLVERHALRPEPVGHSTLNSSP